MSHICTNKSFLAGAIDIKLKCLICRNRCNHKVGYIVQRCCGCNTCYDDDLGKTVKLRRKYLSMSKSDIANAYGVKVSTISEYERWPSKKYWHWILDYQK